MNARLYESAVSLSEEERRRDVGAFFRSLHGTLGHILLADRLWLSRFADSGRGFRALPERVLLRNSDSLDRDLHPDFAELRDERALTDAAIEAWVRELDDGILASRLCYANSKGLEIEQAYWEAITHFFNHQTHHRGQATTILMQLGRDPGPTDLLVYSIGVQGGPRPR
jgi:uncharacterized damage-inducible protein DinB